MTAQSLCVYHNATFLVVFFFDELLTRPCHSAFRTSISRGRREVRMASRRSSIPCCGPVLHVLVWVDSLSLYTKCLPGAWDSYFSFHGLGMTRLS